MRVLFTNNAPVTRWGIARGLARVGCETKVLGLWQIPYEDQERYLVSVVEDFRPDVIFSEGDPPNHNKPAVYEVCRRFGLPHVYWAVQDPLWHKEISVYCASHSDLVFTTAIELVPVYRKMGKPAELLLFACNPEVHHRTPPNDALRHEVVFVGNNYAERAEAERRMIQPLIAGGRDLRVWGQWWDDRSKPFHIPSAYCDGYLGYTEAAEVYSSSAVVLGLHLDDTSKTQTSIRTFEVLGCGGFYLTQYTPAHEHLFKNGVHLVWSKSAEETLELVNYYLKNPAARERISTAGQAEVYAKHTITHRAFQVVEAFRRHLGIGLLNGRWPQAHLSPAGYRSVQSPVGAGGGRDRRA